MQTGLPEYLTKYFKPSDRKYYEDGTIRFGNLAEYRRAEEEMTLGARGDRYEGTTLTHTPMPPTGNFDPKDPKWLELLKKRRAFRSSLPPNCIVDRCVSTFDMNAWVFCASIGTYDSAHHELMLHGDESTGYQGNPELRSWCVFDTHKLVRAARWALRSHEKYSTQGLHEILYGREVEYDWKAKESDDGSTFLAESFHGGKSLPDCDVVRQLTTKRTIFSTEREFRLIARIDDRASLPDNEPPLLLNHTRIRNAIVEFGDCI